jgi:hypothetical protein
LAIGEPAVYGEVLGAVIARDDIDAGRAVAPLRAAADAVIVNTDRCGLDDVVRHALAIVARWPDALTTEGGRAPCGEPLPGGGAGPTAGHAAGTGHTAAAPDRARESGDSADSRGDRAGQGA